MYSDRKMHRSNNSNDNLNNRQSSSLSSASLSTTASSSASSSSASTGQNRRGYNRSHNHNNNFKFHNFVFNETNQKFCLEEQHGNKKITVLHWKKSDDPQQSASTKRGPDPVIFAAGTESNQPPKVRQCDSDSKLIKSEKFTIDHSSLLDNPKISKEISGGRVTSSASFPLSSSSFNRQSFDLSKFESLVKHEPELPPPLPPPPQPPPPKRLPHLNSENSLISSSGHSSASFLSPLESSSSSGRFDLKHSDNDSISKSYFSGSSIASSSCSAINSSLDNLKLNENLYRTSGGSLGPQSSTPWNRTNRTTVLEDEEDSGDESDHSDFDVEDFFYRTYRRKLQQRIENLENLIEETIQSQPLDLSIKRDYNNNHHHHQDDEDGDHEGNHGTKAMNYDDDDDVAAFNTMRFNNESSKLDDDTKSGCESVDSLMSNRIDSPTFSNSRFKSYFDTPGSTDGGSSSWFRCHLDQPRPQQQQQPILNSYQDFLETIRQESLSPSELMSSMKCCSPLSDVETTTSSGRLEENEKLTSTATTTGAAPASSSSSFSLSNPFMFPHERTKMFESFEPIISDDHHHHHRQHFSPTRTATTTTAEMFDALVEEEIQKFLQNSASTSSSSTSLFNADQFRNSFHHHRLQQHHTNDLSKRIEEKLKLLQQEVLNNKLSDGNFGNFLSDQQHHHLARDGSNNNDNNNRSPNPDHSNLRMHFKFDSNKNLEPYLMESGFRGVGGANRGQTMEANPIWNPIMSTGSNLGTSSSNSSGSSSGYLARNRLNHRNQIKRHLEDAFKQNGFLVKTKQVSDANNSAMFCKFRQLRKYTRYYLKSWQNHLPDEVNKLWKGFLPPKTDRPLFLTSAAAVNDDDFVAAQLAAAAAAAAAAARASEASNYPQLSSSLSAAVDQSSSINTSSTSSASSSSQFTPSME